jgi:streptogrisin D
VRKVEIEVMKRPPRSKQTALLRPRLAAITTSLLLAFTLLASGGAYATASRLAQTSTVDAPKPGTRIESPEQWAPKEMLAQLPLSEAANRIHELAAAQQLSGIAGTAFVNDRKVVLYWQGSLPIAMTDLLRELRQNVAIEVRKVPYSLATLDKEARRIMDVAPAQWGTRVTHVGPLPDFSGLQVGIDPSSAAEGKTTIRSSVKTVVNAAPPAVPAAWRWGDTPPFYGGAAIDRPGTFPGTYYYCTTGWAARRRSNNQEVMITARHCGTNKDWRTPEGNRLVGHSDGGNAGLDAMSISGGDYSPFIYIGSWDSSSSLRVGSSGYPSVNQYYCTSGSWSGAVCNNRAQTVNAYADISGLGRIGPGTWTLNANNLSAAGQGDSGGPTFAFTNSNTRARAIGMIEAIDGNYERPCGGIPEDRLCASRVFSVQVPNILNGLSLNLQTA